MAKLQQKINKKPAGKEIYQLDEAGNRLKKFNSITEASNEIGVNSKSIREAANGKQKHAGGFRWEFADVDHEN